MEADREVDGKSSSRHGLKNKTYGNIQLDMSYLTARNINKQNIDGFTGR